MARTTDHTELGRHGFKLIGESNQSSGGRAGEVNIKHYTKLRNTVRGGITRPIVHHVMVSEYSRNPGKYDVSYSLSQDGLPYQDGDYDWVSRHESNYHGGAEDPLGVVLRHHNAVDFRLDKEHSAPPPLGRVTEENVHRLTPGSFHATPANDDIEKQRRIVRGPRYDMTYLNSTQDQPLDPRVHRALTGKLGFEYQGRLDPEDDDTDVYHVSHEDPEDPYMRYGFTIRHRPGAEATSVQGTKKKGQPDLLEKPLAFSYNATHYPIDMGDDRPVGDFMRVSDDGSPVANFTALGPVIERHHNLLRSVGLMRNINPARRPDWHFTAGVKKKADEFDNIVKGNGYAGECEGCGKATYLTDGYRDNGSYHMEADEETGGEMHGPSINLCGTCKNDEGTYFYMRDRGMKGPKRLWHYNDQGVPGCPECESHSGGHLMDQADDDLRP